MRRNSLSLTPGFLIIVAALFCLSPLPGYLLTPVAAGSLVQQRTGNSTTATLQFEAGLVVTTFATPQGRITVYLPDDIAAGDTISGTVVAEPQGANDQERSKNRASLEGYVIEIGDLKTSAKQPTFSWLVLPAQAAHYLLRVVETGGGNTTASTPLSLKAAPANSPPNTLPGFTVPELGQTGRPSEIIGPFDGNAANTTLRFGPVGSTIQDFEKNTENVSGGFGLLRPLAESPRKVVVESPTNVTGPLEILILEGGVISKAPCRNVDVQLTAPKTSLLRGESTTLKVMVSGLSGLKHDVPLHLDTRGVIQMEGGNFQNLRIHPEDVQTGGRYMTTRAITGQQAGSFTCTATVVVHTFDICLQDDANPSTTIMWNTITGDYLFNKTGSNLAGNASSVTKQNCLISLEHVTADRHVSATIDLCSATGSAKVEGGPDKNTFNISDRNRTNNDCPAGGSLMQAGTGLSSEVKSKDELIEELSDLRERKQYDCEHGRKYQQAMAERIAVIKRVLRSVHRQHILNEPIDENCPPR